VRLTADLFQQLMRPFEPFEASPVVAVGVSGGRDSMALAELTEDWARARGGSALALVVDHGLRAESASESLRTVETLRARGREATLLRWEGAKPASGIQERARAARRRLLVEACRQRGILHLLLAHHADDQAETVAMRSARASGPAGLAGMAALAEECDVRVLRPLLTVPRVAITDYCRRVGIDWLEDPSNADPRFERTRVRAEVPPATHPTAASRRHTQERECASDMVAVAISGDGLRLDRRVLLALPLHRRTAVLSRAAWSVGGNAYPPRRDRLQSAVAKLAGTSGFTLAGCRIQPRGSAGRTSWAILPEKGRNRANPLVPAPYFACGGAAPSHLECLETKDRTS